MAKTPFNRPDMIAISQAAIKSFLALPRPLRRESLAAGGLPGPEVERIMDLLDERWGGHDSWEEALASIPGDLCEAPRRLI